MLRQPNVFKALLGLFIIVILSNPVTIAANQVNDKAVFQYLDAAKNSDIEDLTNIDFSEDIPNAYLSIAKFYLSDAQDLVFDSLSNEFVVSESVIRDVVLNNKQPKNLNAVNVRERYRQASKDLKKIQEQKITTYAREVFMNNETSDSPFDLIQDLTDLEKILFNSQSEVLLDGMFESQKLSGLPMGFSNVQPSGSTPDNNQEESSQGGDNNDQDPNEGQTPDTQSGDIDLIPQSQTSECDLDPDLSDQLKELDENENSNQTGSNDQDREAQPGGDNKPDEKPDEERQNTQVTSRDQATSPLPFSDYPTLNNECPEDQMFCLKQENIMGRWGLVIPEDRNCIACKVSQIKAGMSQVLAVNLVPKKVTGNFGEFPYCKEELKKSLILFDFRILSRPMRADDPTTEVTQANVSDILPSISPLETSTIPTRNILERDEEASNLEQAIQAANVESDRFTDEINDLKQGYTDILSRIDLFNRHMKTISTGIKSLRDNANELTKKKKCE